jgi:hypothetical protein
MENPACIRTHTTTFEIREQAKRFLPKYDRENIQTAEVRTSEIALLA